MKLQARNKRLVLERVKKEATESESAFVLPNNLKKARPDNEVFRILDYSDDCTVSVHIGALVLIEGNMVEESRVGDTEFLTCKENFVIGVLQE
jgi:hypothetical protein